MANTFGEAPRLIRDSISNHWKGSGTGGACRRREVKKCENRYSWCRVRFQVIANRVELDLSFLTNQVSPPDSPGSLRSGPRSVSAKGNGALVETSRSDGSYVEGVAQRFALFFIRGLGI